MLCNVLYCVCARVASQQSQLPDMNSFSRGGSSKQAAAAFDFEAATAAAAAAASAGAAGTANFALLGNGQLYSYGQLYQTPQQFVQPYAQGYPTAMFITPPDPTCALTT